VRVVTRRGRILMDHALSRRERGLAGFLLVEIPENPEVFRWENRAAAATSGH